MVRYWLPTRPLFFLYTFIVFVRWNWHFIIFWTGRRTYNFDRYYMQINIGYCIYLSSLFIIVMEIYIQVHSTACPYGWCVLIGLSVKYSTSFLSDPFDNVHRWTIIVHSCNSVCDIIIILLHCHRYCSSENSSIDPYNFHANSLNYLDNIPAMMIMMV